MKKIVLVFVLLFLLCIANELSAQCAMCRASIESNISNGANIGAGLNAGILYLAAMPYLALAIIVYFWMKNSKKNYGKKNKAIRYT